MVAGSELPAMSDWLDQHRERLEPATSDLRGRPVRQTGYCGRCWSPFFELRCSNSAASRSTRNWRSIVRTRQAFRDLHVCRCIGGRRHPRGPSRTSRPGEWSSMVELQLPKLIRCHRSGTGQRLLGTRPSGAGGRNARAWPRSDLLACQCRDDTLVRRSAGSVLRPRQPKAGPGRAGSKTAQSPRPLSRPVRCERTPSPPCRAQRERTGGR